MKLLLKWALIAFVIYFVVSNPVGAANTASAIGRGLGSAADSFGSFLAGMSS